MKLHHLLSLLLIGGLLSNDVLALPYLVSPMRARQEPATGDAKGGTWQIMGETGVNAMHIFLASPNKIVIIDKVEQNPAKQVNGQPAVSTEWNLDTSEIRVLNLASDTFCSAGSWLGNGTMLHTGGDNGNPNFAPGQQTLRFYDPNVGDWVEMIGIMQSKRWYPTMLPLSDGRVIIMGGSTGGTGLNRAEINNPTYIIWPPADGAVPAEVQFPFLVDTLPYNLYVMLHLVPNFENKNLIFVLSNQQSILYDLDTATVVKNYPKIAVQRTYPQTGTSLMLPLYPEADGSYKAEVMVCGGQKAFEILSVAEASCGRMDLNAAEPVWTMDDFGGLPRVMPDSVILVNGDVLFLNGAGTGFAGFRKGKKDNPLWVQDNPVFNPVLYNPTSKVYAKMNPSTIPRMYHSVASLIPDGRVFVAGSNPQGSVQRGLLYSTEYRAEIFTPPYVLDNAPRPTIASLDGYVINQGRIPVAYGKTVTAVVQLTSDTTSFTAAIIHHGFVTHSQNMGQRYVGLVIKSAVIDSTTANQYILTVELPPNPTIIAPGPSYFYVLNNNSPCVSGVEVLLN